MDQVKCLFPSELRVVKRNILCYTVFYEQTTKTEKK
jgi:hypothetical protein